MREVDERRLMDSLVLPMRACTDALIVPKFVPSNKLVPPSVGVLVATVTVGTG
jgi:hypothetical protein